MRKITSRFKLLSLLGISLFTSIGVLTGISAGNKSVEKTEAATASTNGLCIYFEDQVNWSSTGNDPILHIWDFHFATNSGYSSSSDIKSDALDNTFTLNNDGSIDIKMKWISGSNRPYQLYFPWYITQFQYMIKCMCNSSDDGGWKERWLGLSGESGGHTYTISTAARKMKHYFYSKDSRAWSGVWYGSVSTNTDSGYTYSESYYSISATANTGGTVSITPTSGKSSGVYWKNQILSVSATANTGYSFGSWSDGGTQTHKVYATEDKTYTASFSANSYDVTFSGTNGSWSPSTINAKYGTAISRSNNVVTIGSSTSTYAPTPKTGYTPSTTYTVPGTVGTDTTVSASTTYTPIDYTITYETNGGTLDGSQKTSYNIETNTFSLPTGANWSSVPTDKQFGGWYADASFETGQVTQIIKGTTGHKTFYAKWDDVAKTYYEVNWIDGDGVTIKTEQVEEGTTPSYTGADPIKTSTDQYSYTWNNTWSPTPAPIYSAQNYVAQFTPTLRSYKITWKNGSTTLKEETLDYGVTPSYSGVTPTKAKDAQYTYTFDGWSTTDGGAKLATIPSVSGAATYYAHYSTTTNKYTLEWNLDGGTITSGAGTYTEAGEHPYGTSVVAPTVTRRGSNFSAWSPSVSPTLTGNATYTATWTLKNGYYLVGGDKKVWDRYYEYYLEDAENSQKTITLTLTKDTEFKIWNWDQGSRITTDDYGWNQVDGSAGSARAAGQLTYGENGNIKVNKTGTYTIYLKTNWDTNKIWIAALGDTYSLNVKHGDTDTLYNLVLHEGTEYVTEQNVVVSSGDVISVYKGQDLQTMTPKAIGNNNVWDNDGVTTVVLNMEDKFYVDVNAKTIFASGLPYGQYGMVVNNNFVPLKHNETPIDPSFNEWYTETAYEFETGDIIKFVDTTGNSKNWANVFHVGNINKDSITDKFQKQTDDSIICTGDVETMVYLKLKSNADEVFFGNVDYINALNFAKGFNNAMTGVCDAKTGHTDTDELKEAWEAQMEAWEALEDTSAKNILKTATNVSPYPTLAAFASSYDYIYIKYYQNGTFTEEYDFAGRFENVKLPQNANRSWKISDSEDQTILIVVIASASLLTLSAGALAILLKKKKKHTND